VEHNLRGCRDVATITGGATARPPRAAGRAPRQTSKEKFLYIKEKCYNLLGKYFCAMKDRPGLEKLLAPPLMVGAKEGNQMT